MNNGLGHWIRFSLWVFTLFVLSSAKTVWAAPDATDIADNIVGSAYALPNVIALLSYLGGLMLGVSAIIKTKDHVENPNNTPISHPAIRFLAGGALFALPMIYEAAQTTISGGGVMDQFSPDKIDVNRSFTSDVFTFITSFGDSINSIFASITTSFDGMPWLVTSGAYLFGLLLGVVAIIKIKEHVENPNNTPLREGISAMLVAGAFFSLPVVFDAARKTIDDGGAKFNPLGDFSLANSISDILGLASSAVTFGQDFNGILGYITGSISDLPMFISVLGYLLGIIFVVGGILRIRDHVNNPSNTPLRNGIISVLVGGMLFALPTVYSAMYVAVGGGANGGLLGIIGQVFTSGVWISIDSSCGASASIRQSLESGTLTSPLVSGKLDQMLCWLILGTSGLPAFLIMISYMIGLGLGFWAILKVKAHVENPSQTPLWDAVVRFIAAGAFFSLPMILVVAANTMGFAILPYDLGDFSGKVSEGGLDAMMAGFVGNIFYPLRALMRWFAYIAGVIFVMIGISRLLKSTQEGPRGPGGVGTIMTFLTGGALLSLHPMINAFTATMFSTGAIETYAVLSYQTGMETTEIEHVQAVVSAVLQFLILIGTISFLRGIFIFREVAEGGGNASMMAGVTHLVGGAIAINLGPFLNLVQNTLGLTKYGIVFSTGGGDVLETATDTVTDLVTSLF